jgi:hypothetical protein
MSKLSEIDPTAHWLFSYATLSEAIADMKATLRTNGYPESEISQAVADLCNEWATVPAKDRPPRAGSD